MLRAMLTTVAALCLAALATTAAMADDAGKVVSMEGTVEIGRAGAFAPAQTGSAVQSGDTIRTGTPGRARILFADDSVLNVGDASTLVIDETVYDANKGAASTLMHLVGGKVRALVSEYYSGGQASYRIETTTAVSGVRGTEFIVAHDQKTGKSQVLGLGGTVAVHGTIDRKNHGVLIHANQVTDVEKGHYPTPPRVLNKDDVLYRELMFGLDLPGSGMPETLLLDDSAFGGPKVPGPDSADGNTHGATGEEAGGGNAAGGTGGEGAGTGTGSTGGFGEGGFGAPPPTSDLPPSYPGHTGGDLTGQPIPVLQAPTDVDVHF